MRTHSSYEVDNIQPKALQAMTSDVAEPLAMAYQHCLEENTIPTHCKRMDGISIQKEGSCTDPSVYHPITLLPVFSKFMESIITDALIQYMKNQSKIAP